MSKRKILILIGTGAIFCTFMLSIILFFDDEDASWKSYVYGFQQFGYQGLNRTKRPKTILFWNTMFGSETFYFGNGDLFEKCPKAKNCYATHDRSNRSVQEFDAILFHGNALEQNDLPSLRSPHQSYVYVNLESPSNRPPPDIFFDDLFNLTMTYRLDSDVMWPSMIVEDVANGTMISHSKYTNWMSEADSRSMKNDNGKKSRMVAWFVSNCHTNGKREDYVAELEKYIPVDVFGNCGTGLLCPRSKNCFGELLEPNYFFYLSFENSLCEDYVTEKLYNALRYDIVPVVYGGANYSIFAPPHSYINALDFNSPKDLAEFLIKITKDSKTYEKYFWWKQYYRIASGNRGTICKLCELLHEDRKPKIYESLSGWFKSDECPMEENLQRFPYATKLTITNS